MIRLSSMWVSARKLQIPSFTTMGYCFQHTEDVPGEVQRIALEQIEAAIQELRGEDVENIADGIHQAGKRFKKIRALLRLARPELALATTGEYGTSLARQHSLVC